MLLWAACSPERLSAKALALFFSATSLWEVAIKNGLGCDDFKVDVSLLRRGLIDSGYQEIPLLSAHTVFLKNLPALHKDPFDRILVAQAMAEGITLLTADDVVASYPGPIRLVQGSRYSGCYAA